MNSLSLYKYYHYIRKDFLNYISYKLFFVSELFTAFFYILIFYFVSRTVDLTSIGKDTIVGGDYFSFAFLGFSMFGFLMIGLNVFSTEIRTGQYTGVLEYLLTTPSSAIQIILGSSLWGFCRAFLGFIIYMVVGIVFFRFKYDYTQTFLILIIIILTILAISCFGILAASFALFFKQNFTYWISTFLAVFSGIFFPIQVLPDYLQTISYLSPLTYSLNAIRGLLLDSMLFKDVLPDMLILIIFIIIFLPISVWIFNFTFDRARKNGNLQEY